MEVKPRAAGWGQGDARPWAAAIAGGDARLRARRAGDGRRRVPRGVPRLADETRQAAGDAAQRGRGARNVGTADDAGVLTRVLDEEPDPIMRGHAASALRRLDGDRDTPSAPGRGRF
ncbi:hypothetical protein [Roseisolibacter agri]|nr:hypothetical protein [Roseisolibacter agri]